MSFVTPSEVPRTTSFPGLFRVALGTRLPVRTCCCCLSRCTGVRTLMRHSLKFLDEQAAPFYYLGESSLNHSAQSSRPASRSSDNVTIATFFFRFSPNSQNVYRISDPVMYGNFGKSN